MKTVPAIEKTPRQVRFLDVADFENLDERVAAVTVLFGSVIGVNDGFVEWCPDDSPPTEPERMAWIWLCNPLLDRKILPRAKGRFHDLMIAYRAGEMQRWYCEIIRQAEER